MQPLKVVIAGEYWDTQLYEGRLYLFLRDGSIATVNWDQLVSQWRVHQDLRLGLELGFMRSDYLYSEEFSLLLRDPQVKDLLHRKFARLARRALEVSPTRLEKALVSQQENRFPFPHADSAIYNRRMYVGGSAGLYEAGCTKKTKYGVSTRPARRFDAPALAIAPSYGTVALAAGDDGLFSVPVVANVAIGDDFEQPVLAGHFSDCAWAYYSIYGSSHLTGGRLAAFRKEYAQWSDDEPVGFRESVEEADPAAPPVESRIARPRPAWAARQWGTIVGRPPRARGGPFVVRRFERAIDETEIFGRDSGYSWASQDKICLAVNGRITVVQYRPWEAERERRLQPLGDVGLQEWKGDIISGAVSLFGTVVECDNAVVVIRSDGSTTTISGEPVNWRVFPRSKHYENQLHVIFDDRLELYSFNHDYFVDQGAKRSGVTVWQR